MKIGTSRQAIVGLLLWLVATGLCRAQAVPHADLIPADERTALERVVLQVGNGAVPCDVMGLPTDANPSVVIASIDLSGRRFCNEVIRIRMGNPPSILQRFFTWWAGTLTPIVDTLGGGERSVLIIPHPDSDYEGAAACVATTPVVYECLAAACTDETPNHPEVLARSLGELQQELATLESSGPNADRRRTPCVLMETAKIKRLLGFGSAESFQLAETWRQNADPVLRRKAIAIFADIGDAVSRLRLDALTHDADTTVASDAVDRLRRASQR